ncbi:MAG: hypothetical protein O3B31_01970 [Chloroflexi bacterium]|nr:hypothetical protein [Chloroflexota bacterium]
MKTFIAFTLLIGIIAAGAGGALMGTRLARAATRPPHQEVLLLAPELSAGPRAGALTSPGGFTGFGGAPALKGDVARAGTVTAVDVETGRLSIESPGGAVSVRFTASDRMFRLGPLTNALAKGDVVLVRVEGGVAAGVMRVPPDLDVGVGTSDTFRQRGVPPPPPPDR